jgi:hypothetical protein
MRVDGSRPHCLALFFLLVLLVLITCASRPNPAFAVGNLHLGPVWVHPFVEVTEAYDSNIFLAPNHEKDDFITVVSPGIKLQVPFAGKRHLLEAGYRADLYAYVDHTNQNRQDQKAYMGLNFDFPGGLQIKAIDTFTHAAEVETHEFAGGKRFFNDNNAAAEVGYRFAEVWKIQLNYENIYHHYIDAPWHKESSYNDNAAGATLFYQFLPKTSILVEYRFTDTEYPYFDDDARDSVEHTVYGGLHWDPTAKLAGNLKGGYTWKRFEKQDVAEDNDDQTWSIAADLLWRATDTTQVQLKAERIYRDYLMVSNLYYLTTGGGITVSQKILTKLTASAFGYLVRDEFSEKTFNPDTGRDQRRDDKLWMAGAGLVYAIQEWISAELSYAYRDRNSNFDFYEYNDHLVTFRVKLVL